MPKRPLSAYNIFFQDERQRLLEEMNVSQHSLLHGSANKGDQQPKPQVRFAELSRHVAAKWNALGDDAKGLYQALAEKEQISYAREMIYWNAQRGLQKQDDAAVAQGGTQADDSPGSSSSAQRLEQSYARHALSGPWQDTSSSTFTSGLEASVNLPNTKIEPAPSMRPASPMRYTMDTLPLFSATLAGQNPATALHWSRLKQSKPVALPFPMPLLPAPRRASPQHESTFPSPPLAAQQGGCSLMDSTKPQISPSLLQLSDDLDEEEQDFLIASFTGDYQVESTKKKGRSQPAKKKR